MNKFFQAVQEYRNSKRINKSVIHGEFSKAVWLVGDARSGTTWISSLLNADKSYREMFEPFHPQKVSQAKQFVENMYVAPKTRNDELMLFLKKVFDGSLTNSWVDKELVSKSYKGLLIKDVFANLILGWATHEFPNVKPILLVRNPLSVAASKYVTRRWNWPNSPRQFLEDKNLMSTHLSGLRETILDVTKRDDFIEKQVLNWCVIHKVISSQFSLNDIHILCYEKVIENPKAEIENALRYCGKIQNTELTQETLSESSIVAFKGSSIIEKKDPLTIWRETISKEQIALSISLLKSFEFDNWYENLITPDVSNIYSSFKKKE